MRKFTVLFLILFICIGFSQTEYERECDKYDYEILNLNVNLIFIKLMCQNTPDTDTILQICADTFNVFKKNLIRINNELKNKKVICERIEIGFSEIGGNLDSAIYYYKKKLFVYKLKTGIDYIIKIAGCIIDPFDCLMTFIKPK